MNFLEIVGIIALVLLAAFIIFTTFFGDIYTTIDFRDDKRRHNGKNRK